MPKVGERLLAFLPFSHIYGLALLLVEALKRGATTITMPAFQPRLFFQLMQDHKVPVLYAVPPILVLLAKDPAAAQYDLASLRRVRNFIPRSLR